MRRFGAGLLLLVVLAGGCDRTSNSAASQPTTQNATTTGPASRGIDLPDYTINPVTMKDESASPKFRIASTSPACTEICCALGLRDQLVARTRYCDHPPGIDEVPSIGALIDINVEALVALRPDVVFLSGSSRQQADRLSPLGLHIESLPDTTLSDVFTSIRKVAAAAHRVFTGERLCDYIRADLDKVDAYFAGDSPKRVLFLIDTLTDPPTPPYVAGPGSYYDDLLRRAGHMNVVAGERQAFAPLALEFIVNADPHVIIELDPDGASRPNGDADALAVWSKVGDLRAVRDHGVHVLTGNVYYVPGPRIARVYADIRAAIAGNPP